MSDQPQEVDSRVQDLERQLTKASTQAEVELIEQKIKALQGKQR